MDDFPYLTLIGLLPLFGVAVIMGVPRGKDQMVKIVALLASLATLGLTAVVACKFETGGERFQFVEAHEWINAFGVQYAVGVDGIALVLIALVAVLVPAVIVASWHDADPKIVRESARIGSAAISDRAVIEPVPSLVGHGHAGHGRAEHPSSAEAGADGDLSTAEPVDQPASEDERSVKFFFSLILVLETMLIGVFAATDIFLFYVFFEAMLIPMYFLVGNFGGPRRQYAAVKFLLFSLFGGLVMLASVIGLYVASADQLESGTFNFASLTQLDLSTEHQIWLFLGFFLAFAIKAPLFPFHTWLPDAGGEAPAGVAVLLVGVMDKVGTFGFLRYCLPLFPDAARELAPYLIALSVVGIFYGSLLAMGQRDLKRLVCYISVAHFGFITLGVFAFTTQAQTGATFYMVNHGLSTGALFLVIGFLIARGKSRNLDDYSGIAQVAPLLAGAFLLAGLSALALPGLSTFISEFLVLVGTYQRYEVAAILATLGIVLAALYILLMYQRTMQGPLTTAHIRMPDLNKREVVALAPLVAIMVFLGFYPKPVTDIINPAVECTQVDIGFTDPSPTQGGVANEPPTCLVVAASTGGDN